MELQVEGELGILDAEQSLRVLAMLAEVVGAVAPESAELPLMQLRGDSAVAVVEPTGISSGNLLDRVREAFEQPMQLTRRLRSDLSDAFATRESYGIAAFGFEHAARRVNFDERVYRRVAASLARPTGWASVSGEVRSVGRAQSGISGKIRSAVDAHVVNFEAPAGMQDELRDVLFRRATLSGETEVDEAGIVKRIVVERVEPLGEPRRLTDADFSDLPFDSEATLDALRDLRRG